MSVHVREGNVHLCKLKVAHNLLLHFQCAYTRLGGRGVPTPEWEAEVPLPRL